jgi:hypothetical protein
MSRHPFDPAFKPALETLEGRELPASGLGVSLFAGALANNLAALNASETTARNNFQNDQQALVNLQNQINAGNFAANNNGQVATAYAKAQSDYQSVLSYQSAIQKTEAAEVQFMNIATLLSGNKYDFLLWAFMFQPQFTAQVNTANGTKASIDGPANQTYGGAFFSFAITTGQSMTASLPSIASQTHV